MKRALLSLSVLLGACGAGSSSSSGTDGTRGLTRVSGDDQVLTVTFAARAQTADGDRDLRAGEVLRSGDRLELFVEVNRPAYVYVAQAFPDGTAAVLFPDSGDLQLAAGQRRRIPEGNDWFQLDTAVGEEHVFVIASAEPITSVDGAIAQQIADVRAGGADAVAPPETPEIEDEPDEPAAKGKPRKKRKRVGAATPADKLMTMETRGIVKVAGGASSGGTEALTIVADGQGLIVYDFWFGHE